MSGDITAEPAFMFAQWLQLVCKRTSNYRSSGFPHRPSSSTMPFSLRESIEDAKNYQQTEISLWERLGKAEMLDIESSSFSWDRLSSLHHTEHTSSNKHSDDEMSRALEVTINSGGAVFFVFFNGLGSGHACPKEAAAVIKISSSRMATQSERLGYEFAKWLGVQTPLARVVHNTSLEWLQIKEATEKVRDAARSAGDEIGEMTCTELLDALELSRCLMFMSYVHGSPLLISSRAFESQEYAERTSASLGRVDSESNKELEQWNEMLKNDAVKLCQGNNFNTGFFEGSDNDTVVDAYEPKVKLEHVLERIALISEAANTKRPSAVTNSLFIGGALAARSTYTLQHLGITHILCLCANEIGQSESQFPDLFTYKNFSVCDNEDSNISSIFEEACDFIDYVEQIGENVLVHCFEGRSRSATLVLAYLMLRKKFTLSEAWKALKQVHPRSQPNNGFAKILLELDQKLHGKVSMVWRRKPMIKVCPICGENVGLSTRALKRHLQKSHNERCLV